MAQMPRGEPQSVPNPVGDLYDDMLRRKRLQDERSATLDRSRSAKWTAEYFSPFNRLDHLPVDRRPPEFAVVNGRLICTTPPDRRTTTPEVLEAQRQTVERTIALEDNPIGASVYGLATLLGAPPPVRAAAFAVGAIGDVAGTGAMRGRFAFARPSAPQQRQNAPVRFEQPSIRLGALNPQGQATRAAATVTAPMLGTGSRVKRRLQTPGLLNDARDYNQARGHLLANQLGGRGDDLRNLVTLTQNPTNSSHMATFENAAARKSREGEAIEYFVEPLYRDGVLAPEAIFMTATGSRGTRMARVISNPAAQ